MLAYGLDPDIKSCDYECLLGQANISKRAYVPIKDVFKVQRHFYEHLSSINKASMDNYEVCSALNPGDVDSTLHCISSRLEAQGSAREKDLQAWLLVVAGALVFFMQAGFAMVCAGTVRKKNMRNTMLKNLLDACGAAIAYYVCGFAFSFGGTSDQITFIGNANFFLQGDFDRATFFFHSAMSASAVTIVASTLAERCTMSSYLAYSVFLGGFVYPVVAHFIWSENGYLSSLVETPLFGVGVLDFAGSGVVHMTGGMAALCASWVVGPRQNRFVNSEGEPRVSVGLQKGQSVSLQVLGTLILWFGWYGFNSGSALLLGISNTGDIAAIAAVNTTLCAASSAIVALVSHGIYLKSTTGEFSLDITAAINGCLAGLVAITASCAIVTEGCAIVIGICAAWLYLGTSMLLIRWKIDDAVDAIPVHLCNGLWGMIATGLFASPDLITAAFGVEEHGGWFYNLGRPQLLAAQIVGVSFILFWTGLGMIPFFKFLDYFSILRVDAIDEIVGLDATYGGEGMPMKLFDDSSDSDQGLRLKAYQMKYEGKRNKTKVSIDDLLDVSWGNFGDFGSSNGKNSVGISEVEVQHQEECAPSAPENPKVGFSH